MQRYHSLRGTFDALVNAGRSGLVALCGNPNERPSFVAYFYPLDIVYIERGDWGSEYFDADADSLLNRVLGEFSERNDNLSLSELGQDEPSFLESALTDLLWHMAHDDGGVPDWFWENEKLNALQLLPSDPVDICGEFDTFTLSGSGTLETDIQRFGKLLLSESVFSAGGRTFRLSLAQDDDVCKTVYNLGIVTGETFVDDATGGRVPVTRTICVLSDYDWRTLYARARVFIYANYMGGSKPSEKM